MTLLVGSVVLMGCGKDNGPIAVSNITLNETTLELRPGEKFTLVATVLPNGADDKTVVWISGNTSVATVDAATGLVTAITIGEATITATAGGKTATCAVKVEYPVATVKITAGTFTMGSPTGEANRSNDETQHTVTLTKDFYMGKYQVTNAQYAAFLNAKGIGSEGKGAVSYNKDGSAVSNETQIFIKASSGSYDWGLHWSGSKWEPSQATYSDHPVIYVTWYGAKAYADWVGGTLPTEAQWEYACRAGTTTAYSYGNTANGSYMWYSDNSGSATHVVGGKQANGWGLFDMHGNVYEWCLDQWNNSDNYMSLPSNDPLSTTGSGRVARGGSWNSNAQFCRSAFRNSSFPDHAGAGYSVGIRVCFVP